MKEITKIETITIVLSDDENTGFSQVLNGELPDKDGYNVHTTMANALHAARALTKAALFMWTRMDSDFIEVLENAMGEKVKKVCDQWKGVEPEKFIGKILQGREDQ